MCISLFILSYFAVPHLVFVKCFKKIHAFGENQGKIYHCLPRFPHILANFAESVATNSANQLFEHRATRLVVAVRRFEQGGISDHQRPPRADAA